MNYAEAAYFDNNACAHVAKWHDLRVWEDRRNRSIGLYKGMERRLGSRRV